MCGWPGGETEKKKELGTLELTRRHGKMRKRKTIAGGVSWYTGKDRCLGKKWCCSRQAKWLYEEDNKKPISKG